MQNLKLLDYTKKKLDDMYIVMYAIKNDLNIKRNDTIENIDIYTLVGINKEGVRQLVGVYQDKPMNNRHWLDIFENIKSRGLKTLLYVSVDDNKNFKRTVKIAFPSVIFVDSFIYIASRFNKYITEKTYDKVFSLIYKLYSQPTLKEFKNELAIFKDTYNNAIHQKLIDKYLVNLEACYKYSYNLRALFFKPGANTRIYDKIRLSFKSNENYINDLNEIYETLEKGEKFFGFNSFRKKEWSSIINDLIQLFPDKEFI